MVRKKSVKNKVWDNLKFISLPYLFRILNRFYNLKKSHKIFVLFILDYFLIFLTANIVNYLLNNGDSNLDGGLIGYGLLLIMFGATIFVYPFTGQYLSLSRYIKSSEIFDIALRNLFLLLIVSLIGIFNDSITLNLKQLILLWLISTLFIIVSRFSLKEINIYQSYFKSHNLKKVAIYGAGAAGAQLASSLRIAGTHKIVAFFDDSANLWGRKLSGISIYSSQEIYRFREKVDQILFAVPSLSKENSKKIISKIQSFDLPVLKVPSIDELTSGKAKINSLKPIDVEDLLGRGSVRPYKELVEGAIKDLNICITGAGGSIGRELCKQALNNDPKLLIMIDSNESNLYYLEQEILENYSKKNNLNFKFLLGNVEDYLFIEKIFKDNLIDIVFHAAAYKHVPLLEMNPLQGIKNNVFSTLSICKAAENLNLKKVTLISTDKAVRPSNVMGASKRLSELIFQAYANKFKLQENNFTKYCIVRFGNVLNSSGSVVPLFKKQIASGGPITLTHEKVIRYFMTVPEAAQLVIQATTLCEGGEVFLLDMGAPIKIYDLAKQMIRLSGLTIKDDLNPDGDIEIVTSGLRPGEKLYEELLIDAESKQTLHPLIFKANEAFIPYEVLNKNLNELRVKITKQELNNVIAIVKKLVPEWRSDSLKNYYS